MIDVSIIIVNYNTSELTKQCIDSIYDKTSNVEFEIIVVDNDSTDGSKELFIKDKRIRFIEAGGNIGFGKANNIGVTAAKGKYVFFLNSDTILMNNAVKLFYDYCESHEKDRLGAVGCLLENLNKEYVHSYGVFPSIWSIPSNLFFAGIRLMTHKPKKVVGNIIYGEEQVVDYVTGADMFVTKANIEKYGAFDPDFFMYYEDTEMQKRWHSHGLRNIIIKTPRIVHLEGCSTISGVKKKLNEKKLYMNMRSQILYFKKTESLFGYFVFRLVALMNLLPVIRGKYNLSQIVQISKILFSPCNIHTSSSNASKPTGCLV